MSVMLMRCCAPMQSWGVQSQFGVRDAGREPSKSGIIGLLAAALGRSRDRPIADLTALLMGVRVDAEGTLGRDFHTAGREGYLRASGNIERRNVIVSTRYYLADAKFLVGLEGDDIGFLSALHDALRDPVWPLYLGRRAFPPGEPIWLADGLRSDESLERALASYPWLGPSGTELPRRLRLVVEDPDGAEVRPDQPLSFADRRFLSRRVRTFFVPSPASRPVADSQEDDPCISPD